MNAAVLLCLTVVAADSSTAVRAKALYGSGPRNEQVADIEPWISQAVAKAGSPFALPYSGWIVLTGDEQRLYTSKQGGFIIDGNASERNGNYEVEINGCEGFPLQKTVTLKAGERRVVNVTENPAPNNVFIALEAPVSERVNLEAKVGRDGSQVRFSHEDDTTIIDITSEFGIDKATIRRKSDKWPKSIQVRLHLSGLESFKAGGDDVAVEWSVSSTGKNAKRVSLRKGRDELALDEKNPYHTEVRMVGGNGRIPLKDGYFEVPLPANLFSGNPQEISLKWIDFYRN